MKRAAIYIRVSTDEQAKHGLSLGEQKADLTGYAARKGYAVYDIYADEGTSARKGLKRRRELQRLLRDVEAGHVDIILIKCLDRWFRNVADFYEVQKILSVHHVDLECSQEQYNTTTTSGRLRLNIKLSIAQNESDQTSDRIKYVYDGMKRHGLEVCNSYPFGYGMKDRHLYVIEAQRPVIEFIFAQCLAGCSPRTIAARVYDKFRVSITQRQVRAALRTRTYIGERYGIAGFCPAIIDRPTFMQVQQVLSFHHPPQRSDRVYLFSGKIICPSCGRRLTAHFSRSKVKNDAKLYICLRRNSDGLTINTGKACTFGGGIRESVVEKFLLRNIRPLLQAYQLERRDAQDKAAESAAQLQALKEKDKRLQSLFVDGVMAKSEFQPRHEQLQREICRLEDRQERCQLIPKPMLMLQREDFLRMYTDLSDEKKRELWQTLIERIEIIKRPKRGQPYRDLKIVFR